VLGVAPGNVPVYSSDYDTVDETALPTRHAFRSYVDDICMGYKWQCVEFARRWLYVNRGYVFDDIAMAYDIFRLTTVRVIRENRLLPLRSFRNGSPRRPDAGALLIWGEGGEFETTGHVAIVTEVARHYVRIVEQNYRHEPWPEGRDYSRELPVRIAGDGGFHVECPAENGTILGWVIQTADDQHAERIEAPDSRLFNLRMSTLEPAAPRGVPMLDDDRAADVAYARAMGGPRLSSRDADTYRYLCLSDTALAELRRATNELHALFMHATDHVLSNDSHLEPFNLPRALWPRIQQSWNNRRNEMITGRLDFSLSDRGLKVYEYNCDSASCHMEAGRVQGAWARHYGCGEGVDAGEQLLGQLRDAWRHAQVDGVLHVMLDRDEEERYHSLLMQECMRDAGIRSKIIQGVGGLHWAADGGILDADGEPVRRVWKTWAWETALDQLRAECDDDAVRLRDQLRGPGSGRPPRLVDVLLRPEIIVHEPLWTLIPSNKAILPVLWELLPEYPYLLHTAHDLTPALQRTGYVTKPIVGRCGANIRMFGADDTLQAETAGNFGDRELIYQELFPLPVVGGYHVQVNTFSVAGRYAGACVRVEESPVIAGDSDILALRVVADDEFLSYPGDSG